MKTTCPDYREVAIHFLQDAVDYEIRYRYCIESDGPLFYTPRSRRMKVFLDLRMGIESILKSLVAYYLYNGRNGKTLINWIEKYGHNTGKLLIKLEESGHLKNVSNKHKECIGELNHLPVSLRYRMDTWDFRSNRVEKYYKTVGSDIWLSQLHGALVELISLAKEKILRKGSAAIVSVSEILEDLTEPRHSKYT